MRPRNALTTATISRLAGPQAEVHDDFSKAQAGNFTSRTADSGQTYVVTGDTTPKIENVSGVNVLSIANATTAGTHSSYLQVPLTAACRYAFAKVMYGSSGSTSTSSVALATPPSSISGADGTFDIGVHGVYSADGGLEASTWVDMTPIYASDLDGSTLIGSVSAPTALTPKWCGWILCENGTLLTLAPDGSILRTKDTRYIINSGLFAWVETFVTAGDTDKRPYVLEWHAGSSIQEAVEVFADNTYLAPTIFAAQRAQASASLGGDTRGDNVTDAGTAANTDEADLHSYTLSGGTFAANKEKVRAEFCGTNAATATTKRYRAYFGGTLVLDSTALTLNNVSWSIDLTVTRVSSTTFRVKATGLFGTTPVVTYTAVTATAANSLVLKVTGTNGTGNLNDAVCKYSSWEKVKAA